MYKTTIWDAPFQIADTFRERYKKWLLAIAYSGISDFYKKQLELKNYILINIYSNCLKCDTSTKRLIVKFAEVIAEAITKH